MTSIDPRLILSCVLLLSILITSPAAAIPQGTQFTYQGRLLDNGSSASGNHDFRFRLYNAETGGSQVSGTVLRDDVAVSSGRFTVMLDFGPVFLGEAMWLEIALRPGTSMGAYTTLTPRQPLTPIPMALFSASTSWGGVQGVPPGLADGVDNDSLAQVSCLNGQVLTFNGGWVCGAAARAVAPGSGLLLSGSTLDTDPGTLQRRVAGNCAVGQAIRAINADGTVICSASTAVPVVGDSGWLPAPMRTKLSLDLGTSDYDFVFSMVRSLHSNAGSFMSPNMGAMLASYMPAYVGLGGSVADVVGYQFLGVTMDLGDWSDVSYSGGDIRLTAVRRAPDYDSGWGACGANVTFVFSHNLGKLPTFAIVEIAENSDGSGWRVPTMASSNSDGVNWRQTALVAMTPTTATLRTQTSLARFRHTANGDILAPTSGYCRVQLFDWAADYDSGWTSISTALGDRDKWFRHDLGEIPRLAMLWVAEADGGGSWILPAMSPAHRSGSYGTNIHDLTEHWAVVKGGQTHIAQFKNAGGTTISPTAGYVRFLAWR